MKTGNCYKSNSFIVQKKSKHQISAQCKTSRNGTEFRFLASGSLECQVATKLFPNQRFGATVSCTLCNSLPRAKNEKRQMPQKFDVSVAFFNIVLLNYVIRVYNTLRKSNYSIIFFSAWFRLLYRQSKGFVINTIPYLICSILSPVTKNT